MQYHRNAGCTAVVLLVGLMPAVADSVVYDLRPSDETFVLDPSPSNAGHTNSADRNFGGTGSRCISAAEHAAPGQLPKGYFESLLRFTIPAMPGYAVEHLELQLYTLQGNEGGFGIFNTRGAPGNVNVNWMHPDGDWEMGYDTPHDDVTSTFGITYNSLHDFLAVSPPTLLDSFYYDGSNAYPLAQWFTYDISASLHTECFRNVLRDGGTITLLLSPADTSVCFNFTAYLQNLAPPSLPNIRENGPHLLLTTAPDSDADGVPDSADECPATVAGSTVNEHGCPPPALGDFDGDGAVNQSDLDHFEACASGPSIPQPQANCQNARLDNDDDVDQDDFAIFQRAWTGPQPAQPACSE